MMRFRFKSILWFPCILTLFLHFTSQKIVDCLVATVDREIITLFDVKIYRDFLLDMQEEIKESEKILEKIIEIKLLAKEGRREISLDQNEMIKALDDLFRRQGEEKVREKMKLYGLSLLDLENYLQEKLLYEKMISLRSSQPLGVTIKEIENYYLQKYVTEYRNRKEEPPPLVEVISEIENQIRQAKIKEQMADWIKDLKEKAAIKINQDCLKLIEREEE